MPTSIADAGDERFRLLVDSVQDYAIFMLDPGGIVRTWNTGAQRLKGYRADEIVGRHFEVFYPPDVVASGWPREELRRAAQDGRLEDEGWRVRQDGQRFWASVVITALRDASGRLQGFAKVTRDLTERRTHEEALRQSEEQLRLLVGAVDDCAIFMLSPAGEVLTWNAGAQRIKGFTAQEVVGHHFSMFFLPEDVAADLPGRELDLARRTGRAEAEGWRLRRHGGPFWANVVITRVTGADGTLRGFAKVTRDLTEQRRWLELQQSNQRMEAFLAMLAHELRNPLAPLRNAVEVMARQNDLPPSLRDVRAVIDRQTHHLTRLVDDLLDVARITTGKITYEQTWVDVRDVIATSVAALRPQFDAKGQALTLDLPETPVGVSGDATRLAQAFQNLLGNAMRYTPEGGRVTVVGRQEGSTFVTTVTDTGIGLQPEAHERIFQMFAQETEGRARHDGGLGIGLALARTIAQRHGGTLSASSPGPGQGASFVLSLPMQAGAAPANVPDATPKVTPARRVLVVDDNRDSTDSMVQALALMGHVAEGAYAGGEALALADTFRPDVVLLDLNMPGMDGFETAQRLRTSNTGGVAIVAMSGYGRPSDREATARAGFDAHLTKPVAFDQLAAVLARQATRRG